MGGVKPLVKEINNYLSSLSSTQQKAVLAVVKTFASEEPFWENKKYIGEMNKRFAEMESGKVAGITLDTLEANTRKNYKSKKNK